MTKNRDLAQVFTQWQRQFAADAVADDCVEIQRHIQYLGIKCTRADMLEGTNMLLFAVAVYLQMDGQNFESMIKQQQYRLAGENLPFYCLTFDFGKGHFGRILADENLSGVDFADLFNHPWDEYKTAGFSDVWISRLDGEFIDKDESYGLEKRVTEDMYYDYSDEDLSVVILDSGLDDTLLVRACEP